ncbi:MAG: hypothetical protein EOP09_17950, partial [Proteobacteria bacterium]
MKNWPKPVALLPSRKSIFLFVALALRTFQIEGASADPQLGDLKLPPGFKIELVATVPNARGMTMSPGGVLYVGSRTAGKVFAVKPGLSGKPSEVFTLASGFNQPVGVA